MKSIESAVKQIPSAANDTINESLTQSLRYDEISNNNNEEINSQLAQNQSTTALPPKRHFEWTLSSYEISTHIKPIEIKCKVGSVLKEDLCGNVLLCKMPISNLSEMHQHRYDILCKIVEYLSLLILIISFDVFFYIVYLIFFLCVNIIVNCPIGSYHSSGLKKCVPCPQGTYQNIEAQTKCIACPNSTSTRKDIGAKSLSDCKGIVV